MSKVLSHKDTLGNELAYSALAACEGDLEAAVGWMGQAGYLITEDNLRSISQTRSREIELARQRVAPKVEAALTSDLLGESVKATAIIDAALEACDEQLKANRVQDPSTMARNISMVRNQGIEKRLSLEGRPTVITETRKPDEIIRALEGLGVARRVDVETTAEED